jgi:hypothetical protein
MIYSADLLRSFNCRFVVFFCLFVLKPHDPKKSCVWNWKIWNSKKKKKKSCRFMTSLRMKFTRSLSLMAMVISKEMKSFYRFLRKTSWKDCQKKVFKMDFDGLRHFGVSFRAVLWWRCLFFEEFYMLYRYLKNHKSSSSWILISQKCHSCILSRVSWQIICINVVFLLRFGTILRFDFFQYW